MKKDFNFGYRLMCPDNGDNMGESCAEIDNFSKPGKTIAEKANAELEAEREKAQVAETKNQIAKDKYKQDSEKIVLRKTRAEEKAQKEKLAAITEENKRFAAGDCDLKDHKEALGKINEAYIKANDAAYREYSSALENLRLSNPTGYQAYNRW